jgi:tyrosine-protein phosphatase YwqE
MAELLLKKNAIHVIASDAHDTINRPPLLSQAFDRVCRMAGQDVAHALFVDNPSAIVSATSATRIATSFSQTSGDQTTVD